MQATPAAPIASRGQQRSALRARLALPGAKGSGAPSLGLAGLLALAAALLLAPAAQAAEPTVTVDPVSAHTITTAQVSGTIEVDSAASGGEETYWCFEYTPAGQAQWSIAFETCSPGPVSPGPAEPPSSNTEHVSSQINGLTAAESYEVRILYVFPGDGFASHMSAASPPFTTDPAPNAPALELEATPSYITAHIQGSVDPEGGNLNGPGEPVPIHWVIETSETGEPETWSEANSGDITGPEAEESNPIEVHADPSLSPGKLYHYRLRAVYAGKQALTSDATFETLPVAAPAVSIDPIATFTATTAHLSGTVNPEGADPAFNSACRFDYVTQAGWVEGGETFAVAASIPCEPETVEGTGAQEVKADLTGLTPHTTYHVRLFASNAGGSGEAVAVETLTTPIQAPLIEGTSAANVTADSADLRAQIDPGGAETTYHFEYVPQSAFEGESCEWFCATSTPESPSIGADNSLHTAKAAIQGLQPDTTYHYRIVATNSASPAGGTLGPDRTFTTQATGGAFALPDGRAYELVSPPQKDGAEVLGIGGGGVTLAAGDPTQASEDGTSVTYITSAPVGASPPGNVLSTQMFSTRGSGGWSSLDIATPHKHSVEGPSINEGEEYQRFSPDLSHALLVPLPEHETLEPPLAPEIHQEVAAGQEIYLRNNATNTFQAVVTAEPLPQVNFEGATPDLSHVVFGGPYLGGRVRPGGPVGLDPNYPTAEGLWEWADGKTRLVSVLPDGQPAGGLTLLGSSTSIFGSGNDVSATRHAISDDGTRVVWSDIDEEEGSLFTRNMATAETLQVDAVQSGGGVAGGGAFKVANSDGSRVFFTDGNALVTGAHQGEHHEVKYQEGDLYMFEPARPEGERLTDLTLGATGPINVLEANEAGTAIYVRTPGMLTSAPNSEGESATPCTETEPGLSGESVPSACNLYLLRESPAGGGAWSVTFVAGGAEASPSSGHGGLGAAEPLQRQAARVSPSGRYLAFMSRRSLTGYDNRDAISGEPDEEVYLYDAETNRLLCASCDPTGARPVGQYDTGEFPGLAMDPPGTWQGRWVAAAIPGWTQDGAERSTGHQPRYLNDSGRLFFTSSDALVPRDVNGREDVYEYDPAGEGSCQPPSYGRGATVVFDKALGGCVGLISAGTGNTDSAFFDASASGNDVFLTTQDGLVSQDKDGTADMYDARVCTQAEPCPSSLAVSPACTTTDSCRVAPSSQPGISAAPASATFAGAGNVTKKKAVRCARGKKRSHGRCVKAKKKKTRAKRARNNRRPGR